MFSDTQIREVFHFLFLERLLKISDAGIYVLKGGVNLRFFFLSPRYSEDMDLDVLAGSVPTLKKKATKFSMMRHSNAVSGYMVLMTSKSMTPKRQSTQRQPNDSDALLFANQGNDYPQT